MARGGGGRGGGRGRGRGRGGGGGGRGRGGSGSGSGGPRSAIYSLRHKHIFDDDGADDQYSYNDAADDFALDEIVGGSGSDLKSGNDNPRREYDPRRDDGGSLGMEAAKEIEERQIAARQKKLDRKSSRKQAKTDAKANRVAAQQAWAEQCKKRREERQRQQLAEQAKLKKEAEKLQKQQKQQQQQQQQKTQKASVAAAPAGKKKGVAFDIPAAAAPAAAIAVPSSSAVRQQQKAEKKQAQKQQEAPTPAAAAPTASAYVPPALRARMQKQEAAAPSADAAAPTKQQQASSSSAEAAAAAAAAVSLAKYVVPARRALSASLSGLVQRSLNKLVTENVAAIAKELLSVFDTSAETRSDIVAAIGASVVNSSLGSVHLTTRQAVAIAAVVRTVQLKCGVDVGAAIVSCVAAELRACILIGPDNAAVHSNKFLEDIERRASHGAIMLAGLTHMSCCSPHLALGFLHECSTLLQRISDEQQQHPSAASFLNEATCIASCSLQLLRVVGEKLHELVPMQLNRWINDVDQSLAQQRQQQQKQQGAGGFATIRLEVVLSLAKQLVVGGGGASSAAGAGNRRQRAGDNNAGAATSSSSSNAASSAPDDETMAKALDALADVLRPGATAQDRRAWKRACPTMVVPTLEWETASQPEKQGPRWWEQQQQQSSSSSSGLLWEKENEEKLSAAAAAAAGVERRDLLLEARNKGKSSVDEDSGDARPRFDAHALQEDENDEDEEDDDDDEEAAELKRDKKMRGIKRLRAFENAASGQRFVSERQRAILQVLDTAFDDGEACQRLMLHLQKNEASDVAAVIVQCAMQEATYNDFYAKVTSRLLAPAMPKKLLSTARKAFQYALWDKFGGLRVAAATAAASGAASAPPPDVASLVNLACFVVHLFADERYDLSLLRGLDIDVSIPAPVGLFLRILLLRALLLLDFPTQLVDLFFGHHRRRAGAGGKKDESDGELEDDGHGGVRSVLGANSVVKQKLRAALLAFVDAQFVDEAAAARWMVPLFDVVAGNSLEEHELATATEQLPRRIKIMRRAIKDGGE